MESLTSPFVTGHSLQNVRHKERILSVLLVDRRIARTRTAILDAFRDLVFAIGYDALSVRDITTRANVGRSTFYEHFDDKRDVLRHSITIVLTPLANVLDERPLPDLLARTLVHVWESRELSRSLLTGATRPFAVELLTELIESRLQQQMRSAADTAPLIPLPLAATQLAEAQIGVLAAWLSGSSACDAATLAQAIVRSTRASADAILGWR